MTDGFLSRWSRRKLDAQEGKPVLAEPPAPVAAPSSAPASAAPTPTVPASPILAPVPVPVPAADAKAEPAPEKPLPTLADAQALTPQSDFKPFMARGVAADVKNAAMKKLFTDPHFNVMDRLDTYIDDYSLPDPIPEAMLRQMVSAKFLNLFDEKEDESASADAVNPAAAPHTAPFELPEALPQASSQTSTHASSSPLPGPLRDDANTPTAEVVAQSQTLLQTPIEHDHLDLRLQPDDALEGKRPGRGPE